MGLLGGYFGGWLDTLVMRIVDVLLACPGFLLALAIVATLGSSMTNVTIAVGIAYAPGLARVTRSAVIGVREYEYVAAARAAGAGDLRIMFRHILPNSHGTDYRPVHFGHGGRHFVRGGSELPRAWARSRRRPSGAACSAPRGPSSGWLTMRSRIPGLAIMLTVLSLNMLGDGLRDAFDPRMRS